MSHGLVYKRVERYLDEPEAQQFSYPSENIVFDEAAFNCRLHQYLRQGHWVSTM
jgi:hypothetical protein